MTKKIIVYAHTSPESMYAKGIEAGLTPSAANYLRYFEEVQLVLDVQADGTVVGCRLISPNFTLAG